MPTRLIYYLVEPAPTYNAIRTTTAHNSSRRSGKKVIAVSTHDGEANIVLLTPLPAVRGPFRHLCHVCAWF